MNEITVVEDSKYLLKKIAYNIGYGRKFKKFNKDNDYKMKNNAFINVINNPNEIYNHKLMINCAEQEKSTYAFEIYNNENMKQYKENIMATAPYSFYIKE